MVANRQRERALTDEEKREAQKRLQEEFERRVAILATQIAIGLLSIGGWLRLMTEEVRTYHLAAALIASDGQLTPLARQIAEARIGRELRFLRAFGADLDSGKLPIDAEARIRQRAKLYSGSGDATFEEVRLTQLGLPRLPAYPKDHSTSCRGFCYCRWGIVQLEGDGNYDAFWHYDPLQDNCEHCPRRAAAWFPLQIRGGVIQPYSSVGLFRV